MDGAPATPVPGPARSGATYAKDDSVTLEDGLALWVPELKDQKLQHVIQVCVEEMLTDFDDLVDMATSTEALIKQGFKKVVATKIMLALVKCGAKDAAAAHGEVASGSGGSAKDGDGSGRSAAGGEALHLAFPPCVRAPYISGTWLAMFRCLHRSRSLLDPPSPPFPML